MSGDNNASERADLGDIDMAEIPSSSYSFSIVLFNPPIDNFEEVVEE